MRGASIHARSWWHISFNICRDDPYVHVLLMMAGSGAIPPLSSGTKNTFLPVLGSLNTRSSYAGVLYSARPFCHSVLDDGIAYR